jgi:hypothetical protein
MILSSHNEIWQSIRFGKAMPIVQNMCFLICYNRHTSFGFFLFILIFSWHTATNHRDSINTWKGARIANVYYIKKKGKRRRRRSICVFFRHQPSYFFIRKIDSYWWLRNTYQLRKQNFSLTHPDFFLLFRFFIFFRYN